MNEKSSSKRTTLWLCITAMFMALNVAMSSFGVPVPGGHLYMNDIVICTAAIILDPFAAFMVGGVGAFLGDLLFYPTPMFVSLATHGLQAVVISVFFTLCYEKASGHRIRNRCYNWCCNHGGRVFAWKSIYLQYTGICDSEASVSNIAGGCRCCCRYVVVLEVRNP